MNNTRSTKNKGTSTLHYSTTYDSNSTYINESKAASTTSQKADSAPRRVISESSFKARVRNNINY